MSFGGPRWKRGCEWLWIVRTVFSVPKLKFPDAVLVVIILILVAIPCVASGRAAVAVQVAALLQDFPPSTQSESRKDREWICRRTHCS